MARPLFKSSHYFSIGLQHTASIQVTWKIWHILLSAIHFHHHHPTTKYLEPSIICPSDNWLADEHLGLLHLMIDNNKIILPEHTNVTLSKPTMCLNTFFSKLIDDEHKALEWLEIS